MKKSGINLIFLFALLCAGLPPGARTISGRLLSSVDSLPIPGAQCELKNRHDVLTRTATSTDGAFSLTTAFRAAATLEITMTGMAKTTVMIADGNLRASYHQGNSEFVLTYNPSWRNYQDVYDDKRESYLAPDFRVDLESHDRDPFHYFHNPFSARYNFRPREGTVFSATFSGTRMTSARRYTGWGIDSQMGDYLIYNTQSDNSFSPSLDLFLHHEFNNRSTLEVQVVGTASQQDYKRSNSYDYTDDGMDDTYINDINSHRYSLISEVTYEHNFSDTTTAAAATAGSITKPMCTPSSACSGATDPGPYPMYAPSAARPCTATPSRAANCWTCWR